MNKKLITTLVLSSMVASAFAINAGAAPTAKQLQKDETGAIHNIVGQLGNVSGATAEERGLKALDLVGAEFGFDKADKNFKVKTSHKDEMGVAHTKFDRTINGITVFGEQMIVHENAGDVNGVTGAFKDLMVKGEKASLKAKDAIANALASVGVTGELEEAAKSELVYFPQGEEAILSYKVSFSHMGDAPGRWEIFVNAVDGSIVNSINKIEHVHAVGTGTGVLGDTKSLNTNYSGGTYYMEDLSKYMYTQKGSVLRTQDYRNGTFTKYNMTDADNIWNATTQRAAVDAHFYAGTTYDYYYNKLGRNSYDGAGRTILSLVRYSTNYNNAFWNGSQMTYGDGDGVNWRAFSGALDVVAHEITHGVTEYTSDLVYQNQSGALNESWSDALAAAIEGKNWTLGEDLALPSNPRKAFRSMSDPGLYGHPDHMSEYINTSSDNGGVHSNSGIPNKAFYNFATAIGSRDIAAKIWYTASRDYMTSSTNFAGARSATLQATAALYGSGSSYYSALQNAWTAVGI